MNYQCPGQDKRNLKIETIQCHYCGYGIEIFSDETKSRCPRCKKFTPRSKMPSCVDWCKAGRECSGS